MVILSYIIKISKENVPTNAQKIFKIHSFYSGLCRADTNLPVLCKGGNNVTMLKKVLWGAKKDCSHRKLSYSCTLFDVILPRIGSPVPWMLDILISLQPTEHWHGLQDVYCACMMFYMWNRPRFNVSYEGRKFFYLFYFYKATSQNWPQKNCMCVYNIV
mgnify:CR=1 FL=1